MQTTWIVIADSSRARIVEQQGVNGALLEIEDFINPIDGATENQLVADQKGETYGVGERFQAQVAAPAVSPHEHQTELFARSLTEYLQHANGEHRFHHLRLIAAPKFLGMIHANLSKDLEGAVSIALDREVAGWSLAEIETYLHDRPEAGDALSGGLPAGGASSGGASSGGAPSAA